MLLNNEVEIEVNKIIKSCRSKFISSPSDTVNLCFKEHKDKIDNFILDKNISGLILLLRETAWQHFLKEEEIFNNETIKLVTQKIGVAQDVLNSIINKYNPSEAGDELIEIIKIISGEYAGEISPLTYILSLSNTNSRRSRAGKVFESIIYTIYQKLDYSFDSQASVGRQVFSVSGLGKVVDSVLPGFKYFEKKRNKVIIGSMKTTLRERWQEVAEEIGRTNIPSIHLLTVDENISLSKAKQMEHHNIILVTLKDIKENGYLASQQNVISFEEYMFNEIPEIMRYWSNNS